MDSPPPGILYYLFFQTMKLIKRIKSLFTIETIVYKDLWFASWIEEVRRRMLQIQRKFTKHSRYEIQKSIYFDWIRVYDDTDDTDNNVFISIKRNLESIRYAYNGDLEICGDATKIFQLLDDTEKAL